MGADKVRTIREVTDINGTEQTVAGVQRRDITGRSQSMEDAMDSDKDKRVEAYLESLDIKDEEDDIWI